MSTAVMALDQMVPRLTRRKMLPEKVGKEWTEEEERQLRDEFNRDEPLPLIASKHSRTLRAIRGRLELLGLLEADQRASNTPFRASQPERERANERFHVYWNWESREKFRSHCKG